MLGQKNTRDRSLLIIDETLTPQDAFAEQLEQVGFEIHIESNAVQGSREAADERYSVALLNWDIPGMDACDVLRNIRVANPGLPVIILSARATEFDRILGLELGADDFVSKPCSALELGARIKAVLRRAGSSAANVSKRAAHGELSIDFNKREVRLGESRIDLSATEFDILAMLALRPGHVFARDEIVRHVWGFSSNNYGENVTAHINRMRRKIERDLENPKFVHTVRGVGYRFASGDEL